MDNLFQRDERIEDDSPLRVLELKVHYLMKVLSDQGILLDEQGYNISVPDDMPKGQEIVDDATTVMREKSKF
jgi:hypothetical protein